MEANDSGQRLGDSLGNGMLDGLHADDCPGGQTYSAMRPAGERQAGVGLAVVMMRWCGDCNAAAWELVA